MSTLYVDEIRARDPNNLNKIDLTGTTGQVYTGTWLADTTMLLGSLTINTAIQETGNVLTVAGNLHCANITCDDISVADLIMSNDRPNKLANEVDGTKGSWVMQEGEDNMYLINRKTGKQYKFVLEEVKKCQ